MKAYSYIRFSKQSQAQGDSYRRQSEQVKEYCNKHNLILSNQTFEDLGISAYSGDNISTGALSLFIEGVKSKAIPTPCYLLLENLDRLSRAEIKRATMLFLDLLDRNVTLVTLSDSKVYDSNSEMVDVMQAIMILNRGWEESETKSKRVRAAKQAKRETTLAGETKFTGNCPKWLKLNKETQTFEEIPEFVDTLKRIFDMRSKGYGIVKILKTLNEEGTIAFGSKTVKDENGQPVKDKKTGKIKKVPSQWSQTTVVNYLKSKAVIGEFQLRQDGVPIGDPIPNYFPTVIEPELFYRVQDTFGKVTRGRTATFRNPLVGLLSCHVCGGPIKFDHVAPRKGRRHAPKKYLRCKSTYEKKHKCFDGMINFTGVLNSVIALTAYLNFSKINSEDHDALTAKLSKLDIQKKGIEDKLKNYSAAIADGLNTSIVIDDMNKLSTELEQIKVDIETTKASLSSIQPSESLEGIEKLDLETEQGRRNLNLFLKQYVEKIQVDKNNVYITFFSQQIPHPVCAPLGLNYSDPEVLEDRIDQTDMALNIDSYFEFDEPPVKDSLI
ncbi:recombinase family protein [Neptuniibacter sp. QD48_11]|uniref:recombinase family protein n=1 Tax=Neptuniibacter sp. QD48_11 TaxID=3398211 RepID=UPI0039F543B6